VGRGLSAGPDPFDVGADLLDTSCPLSGWANLGLWRGHEPYAAAAEALAHAVGRGAALAPGDRVLELACGAGAGLSLWRASFGVSDLHGIELEPSRAAAAQRREPGATIVTGPALRPDGHLALSGPFDAIVCVDAAYHLGPVARLARAAATALAPGGRLAFTTLALSRPPRPLEALGMRALEGQALIPTGAILARSELPRVLAAAHLTDVQLHDLSAPVLLGFASFVRRRARALSARQRTRRAWLRIALTARAGAALLRSGLGAYLLVTARASREH